MLPHDLIRAPGSTPTHAFVFVHGILGTRANWRGLARKLVSARPEWLAVTVDLPMHGDAQGFSPPWDLALCGRELARLISELELPLAAISGHSFGGKAVLSAMRMLAAEGQAAEAAVWIVDSPPGLREDPSEADSYAVLQSLRSQPREFASRAEFPASLQRAGLSSAISIWLAMNLRRGEDGIYRFELQLDAIEALLQDYFRQDAWPWMAELGRRHALHFVHGVRSQVYVAGERERLQALADAGELELHGVQAGHWVHAEAPGEMLDLLLASGPGPQRDAPSSA